MALVGPHALVSLRAFGDLVIARWALRRLSEEGIGAVLLIGAHLVELNSALGCFNPLHVIAHRGDGVPALFDLKKSGWTSALRSAIELRRSIGRLNLPGPAFLLFDRLGPRERFLAGRAPHAELQRGCDNIYLAYEKTLGFSDDAAVDSPAMAHQPIDGAGHVGIFPGSRISAKRMPPSLVEALFMRCLSLGKACKVIVLEGETCDLNPARLHIEIVPRSFAAMVDAVRGAASIVSADSMPAHMAEYFGVPVFVLSPVPNLYWLPKSCFSMSLWSLFSDPFSASDRLANFVGRCSAMRIDE